MTLSITRSLAIFLALIIGAAATLWGLSQIPLPINSLLSLDSWRGTTLLIVAAAVALYLLSIKLKINLLASGGVAAIALSIATGTAWSLLVTFWFGLASYILGGAILALLKIDKDGQSHITAALVGATVYGTVVGILAHFPINYPGLYGCMLVAPVAWKWRDVGAIIRTLGRYCGKQSGSNWHDLVIALIALVLFSVALMPEVGADALAMHLFVPGHLATRHAWGFDVTTYIWAVMPMMGDWLFSIVYMMGGETSARLLNVGFIFILCWLIRELVIWAGGNGLGARWAVLLFLATPLTFLESSSLFIESVWATFLVGGTLAIFKLWSETNNESEQLKIAGILIGAAAASKAVTLNVAPVLLLLMLLSYRNWTQRKVIGATVIGAVLFIGIGGTPYAVAWLATGNPVFPFFNQLFHSPFFPSGNFDVASLFEKGLTWDILYQVTFHTANFLESNPGGPGFQWIILLFPALALLVLSWHRKGVMLIMVALGSIALTFHSVAYLRYIFPAFAWTAAGIGVAMTQINAVFTRRALICAGCMVIVLNLMFFNSATQYGDLSWQALLSPTDREIYLSKQLPIRIGVALVNQANIFRTPVAVFSTPLAAGLNSEAFYPNWYNYQFQAKVTSTKTTDDIVQLLQKTRADYVILDSNWDRAEKRKMIEEATDKLFEQDSITVRKLKDAYQFPTELLKNPDFTSYDGWELPPGMQRYGHGMVSVSAVSPLSQRVPVVAGQRYRDAVTVLCKDKPAQGRIQVNWMDSKSNFISTDIRVFDCNDTTTTHSMIVAAPRGAVTAAVYASGHTEIPVIFNNVSFRQ